MREISAMAGMIRHFIHDVIGNQTVKTSVHPVCTLVVGSQTELVGF